MRTSIDRAGRVVVPRALRQAVGLQPGCAVEMRVLDGGIEMQPAPLEVRIERHGGLLVAVPDQGALTMTATTVEETIANLRLRGTGSGKRRR
jgi:AbrB family looped-hinge helix DNA binding protein